MKESPDTVLRAMTNDGTFRVVAARTTQTVQGALGVQAVRGATARYLSDLLTGVVLVRITMSPQLRVQGILRGSDRSGTLIADAHPTGSTRALVSGTSGEGGVTLGDGSLLRMMRTLHDGSVQQGIVSVPNGSISNALMAYMQESEQNTTMISVGTVFGADGVVSAGGYLVQLLPGAERGPLMVMTERLEEFVNIDERLARGDFSPRALVDDLLYAMPFTELGENDVRYECWCSQISMMSALSTLPREEVQSMIDDGQVIEVSCDYCTKEYRVSPAELRGLVEAS